jgi:putative acetyltransferase
VTMRIRPEHPDDHDAITRVVARAFGSPAEAELVTAIRASPGYMPELALVALVADRVVGHVMISGASLVDGGHRHRIVMLSPLAVEPSAQRRGIGSALVRQVTKRADDRGEPLVVLEGDPEYYGRFGFEHATPLGIEIDLPSWARPEAAQVLRLTAYDPSFLGRVVYPQAFDRFAEE